METGINGSTLVALAGRQQQYRMEVLSNNIANAGAPGFKKDVVRFRDLMSESSPDMEQGNIHNTGRTLDLALSGEGFFKVKNGDSVLYTRSGSLKLDKQGTLVTQDGIPVLGKNGPIRVKGEKLRVEPDGRVFDDDQNVGSLDLVRFPPGTQLTKEKNGGFMPVDPSVLPVPVDNCTVQQGNLEEANFSIVQQMTQMIDTMRTFEACQRMIRSFDQIDSQLMNKYASP